MAVAEGVLAGVAVRGGVTAADVATREAETEVYPRRADPEALLAALRRTRLHGPDEAEMGIARSDHAVSPGRSTRSLRGADAFMPVSSSAASSTRSSSTWTSYLSAVMLPT